MVGTTITSWPTPRIMVKRGSLNLQFKRNRARTIPLTLLTDSSAVRNIYTNENDLFDKINIENNILSEDCIEWMMINCTEGKFQVQNMWFDIFKYQTLNEDFIDWISSSIHYQYILKNRKIWNIISKHQTLSENFIKKYQHNVVWYIICQRQILSENFIKKFQHKLCSKKRVKIICQYQTLSEEFIKWMDVKFQEKVNWTLICQYQTLSENFIEQININFQEKVIWLMISQYQILSEEFIEGGLFNYGHLSR